jgi:hypothetical protein
MADPQQLIESVTRLKSKDLEAMLERRREEDKTLRALWRSAVTREQQERRIQQEVRRHA